MEYKIYLIEDCKGLKYVGCTKHNLNRRLSSHKSDKKIGRYCSSCKLNLDDCRIICIDECNKEDKKDKESYWINRIDSVNDVRLDFNHKEYNKEYQKKNKEYFKEYSKEYRQKYSVYQNSWGGDSRYNNNLLKIDINIFL